jgi:hypothetical protein
MPEEPDFEAERRKTQGWVAEFRPVGENEFTRVAEAAGFEVHVVARDGQEFGLRTKMSPQRIHVRVANGQITSAGGRTLFASSAMLDNARYVTH